MIDANYDWTEAVAAVYNMVPVVPVIVLAAAIEMHTNRKMKTRYSQMLALNTGYTLKLNQI